MPSEFKTLGMHSRHCMLYAGGRSIFDLCAVVVMRLFTFDLCAVIVRLSFNNWYVIVRLSLNNWYVIVLLSLNN